MANHNIVGGADMIENTPMVGSHDGPHYSRIVNIGEAQLEGQLTIPEDAQGIVLFVHGSGSSRRSPRNQVVASALNGASLATLLFDLLTPDEESIDLRTRQLRFDIDLLTVRTLDAIDWVSRQEEVGDFPVGLFGASTGAAAALDAASVRPGQVQALVSRGGRPDLARRLPQVQAPTLLIVGGLDTAVLGMNRSAAEKLGAPTRLEVVPGATHLFEESGCLEHVAELARDWFLLHLGAPK